MPILIGRAIAFSLLGAYFVTAHLVPWAVILFIPVALVVMPPLVVRSLRFRARYSAWRGLHFRFTGAYSEAWTRYGLALLLVPLTLGFALPFVHATQKEYLVGNHHFGGRTFRVRPLGSVYFEAFAKAVGLGIAVVFLTVLFLMLLSTREGPVRSGGWVPAEAAGVVLGYAGMFTVGVYYTTRVLNGMYNHTGLGKFRFESRLQARRMVGLYLANTLAVVLTLGLAYPWARVQMARYRARSLAVVGPEDLDGFVAEAREHQEAVGAEIGDAFDVDIGI